MFLKSEKDTLSTFVNNKFMSPGPTYYIEKSAFQPKSRIVTGSLYGPKELQNDLGSFGSSNRFQKAKFLTPGPADYNQGNKQRQLPHNLTVPKRAKYTLPNGAPSIPPARNKIGQVLQGWAPGQQKQHPQAANNFNAIWRSKPAYSFPKSEYPSRNPITTDDQFQLYQQGEALEWIGEDPKVKQIDEREQAELKELREQNQRRKQQLLEMIVNTNTVPSLQILQLRKKFIKCQIPGPGTYQKQSIIDSNKDSKKQLVFSSNVDRFYTKDQFPEQFPGKYDSEVVSKVPAFSFARQTRNLMNAQPKQPQPYNIEIVPKKIVRPSAQPFGSGSIRFRSSSMGMLKQSLIRQEPRPIKQPRKKLRKSITTVTTAQTQTEPQTNLQSINVLFHMYGNL